MRRKIGYDARMIEHSGIGVRIQHILKYWPISEKEADLFVFGDPEVLKNHILPKHVKIIPYSTRIYSLKEWIGHPEMSQMDILDIPHFNVPFRFIKKCIVTIHDLIPFHFKTIHSSWIKRIYLQLTFRIISKFAFRIIAVSEYTRNDFQKHFLRKQDGITVIYNGIDPEIFHSNSSKELSIFREKLKLPAQFLLTIGIGKKHKNFDFLISNLIELWESKKLSLPLVLGGMGKEVPSDLEICKQRFPEQIFFLPYLPYQELPLLYKAADLFLFPSLFEGFGFPVLEAQASGTPVLSSDATVLPEILRDSALLFDARNSEDFQRKLVQILGNPEEQGRLRSLGQKNAGRFHWKDQIQALDAFYRQILV